MATKDRNGALHDEEGKFTGNGGGGAKKETAKKTTEKSEAEKRSDAEKTYNTHSDLNEHTSIQGGKKVTITNKMYLDSIKDAIAKEGYKVADTMNKLALEQKAITIEQYSAAAQLIVAALLG
jgi:hypothetical protein